MKNSVLCPNCKSQNPFYNSICSNCRFYLREKIINLDLWSIAALLIESPTKAFQIIIFSEHKNFILFISGVVFVKYLINARFVSMISMNEFQSTVGLEISYLIVAVPTLIYFILFSFSYTYIGKFNNIYLRFNDSFAVLIYSQIPFLFGLVLLFTLELVIFGDFLFSINPSPFIIKGLVAYLFLILETGVIIWSSFLIFKAFLIQSQNIYFSLVSTVTFIVLLSCLICIYSLYVFTI